MLQRLGDGAETVKLIDFGIAKIEPSRLAPGITTVMVAGTVRYMAPEQLCGESSAGSDIYSLALTVCEMLCGQPDGRALPSTTGHTVRKLLEWALAYRPEDRPRKIGEWSEQLATALESRSRDVIEKVGAFEPFTEGFLIHNDLSGTVAENAQNTEYDGWRVTSFRQGHYYRHLTARQKQRALARGWTLSAIIRAEEGMSFAGVDFAGYGRRFDLCAIAQPDADLIRLPTQALPFRAGMDRSIPRQSPVYRRYELHYDPGLGSATLLVDGQKFFEGYRGWTQFQEDWGLTFGTAVLASRCGVRTFQSVRFEIHP